MLEQSYLNCFQAVGFQIWNIQLELGTGLSSLSVISSSMPHWTGLDLADI
jgi:hypothetical protein